MKKTAYLLLALGGMLFAGNDWTHWRGHYQNGVSEETNLPDKWSPDGENLFWKADFGTRSTPLVLNGRVYAINLAGEGETAQERVVCMDLKSGNVIWEHRFPVFLTDIVAHRVGWANLAGDPETGNIYAHGVQGMFYCFDKDGKILWSYSLTESFGRISGYGGRTNSPVVDGDKVILSSLISGWGPHGRPVHRFWAVDKNTGEFIWWASPSEAPLDTTYSVPVIATHQGRRTLFCGLADGGIYALDVNTGETIWKYQLSKRGINSSVIYQDGKVYASHSEENLHTNVMGALVCIDANGSGDITETNTVWRIDGLGAGYASPSYIDGMVLAMDNSANIHAIDAKSGEKMWLHNYGTAARGSALVADGKIYIGEMNAKYHIITFDKKGAKTVDSHEFLDENGSPIEIFGTPSVAQGRVILPTIYGMYCIGLKNGDVVAKNSPPAKVDLGKPGEMASIQIVPAESWIQDGSSEEYTVFAFDAKGRKIGKVDAKLTNKGVKGSISGNTFKPESHGLQAGVIEAEHQGQKASARLRVVPNLPYKEDFEGQTIGETVPGWITSKPKSNIMEMDGSKVLRKTANRAHPAFARMRNYVLPPLDQHVTIQADVRGEAKKRRFVPDMGVLNSGYLGYLVGTAKKRQFRLVAWAPMPRLLVEVPYDWQADTWYTVKVKVSEKDGKGLIQGKVWPRGESEPEAWTIEMHDPTKPHVGSPGLYGYSVAISDSNPGTEIFYDNVIVTPNK